MGHSRAALARRLLVAISWTLATALAAAIAWGAVSRLGVGSSGAAPTTLTQNDVQIALDRADGSVTTPAPPAATTTTPVAPTRPGPSPTRGGKPPTSAQTEPAPSSAPQPSTAPTSTPGSSAGSTAAPPPSAPGRTGASHSTPPQRHAKSWQLTGGSVGVSCQGPDISLEYATPRDGWEMDVEKSGPETVAVKFSREDHESQLTATCKDGNPVAESDESGDDGGGGHE